MYVYTGGGVFYLRTADCIYYCVFHVSKVRMSVRLYFIGDSSSIYTLPVCLQNDCV